MTERHRGKKRVCVCVCVRESGKEKEKRRRVCARECVLLRVRESDR